MDLIEITESKIVYIDKFKLAKSYLIFYKIFNWRYQWIKYDKNDHQTTKIKFLILNLSQNEILIRRNKIKSQIFFIFSFCI